MTNDDQGLTMEAVLKKLDKEAKARKALSKDERDELADKLIDFGDRGGGRTFMDKLREKIEVYGIERPEVEVMYRGLTVKTEALVGSASIPTVLSPYLWVAKQLITLPQRLIFGIQDSSEHDLTLVDGISGILKPGRMTLLLGPPSSGKSSFMKALAGRLGDSKYVEQSGNIWFNGQSPDQFEQARSVAYVAQVDNHEANLTVSETLDFSYLVSTGKHGTKFKLPQEILLKKLQTGGDLESGVKGSNDTHTSIEPASSPASGVSGTQSIPAVHVEDGNGNGISAKIGGVNGSGAGLGPSISGRNKSLKDLVPMDRFEETLQEVWGTSVKVDLVMKLLGLYHCRDTFVGNELLRGISGGEKKRLTTAEQLMGTRSVILLDEMSTGLDSATLFTVIRWLSKWCHAMKSTTVISLLQPPPEVFQLFDDVLIFSGQGQEIYHGPVQDAVPFFATLGFDCPTRKDVPSYLLELTTAKGQLQYANEALRAAHNLPMTGDYAKLSRTHNKQQLLVPVEDIRHAFWENCEHGRSMAKELVKAPVLKPSHPAALVKSSGYPMGVMGSIAMAVKRQITLMMRDKVLLKGRVMQVIVISLLSSSLFYNLGVSLVDARTFFGLCFLIVLFVNFGGFPQLPLTLEAKKVWFKHRSNGFYPAYAQGLAMSLAQLPLSLIESIIISLIMYFMVGFYRDAAYFFTFMFIAFTVSLTSSALFRFLACVSPDAVIANAIGGLLLVTLIISSGFAILRTDIPDWMIWAYWVSPFAWALRAFAINELTSPKWTDLPYPDNPDGSPSNMSLGEGALLSFGFFTERYWIWANIGFQLGLYIVLTFAAILCLWLQKPEQPRAFLPDEEAISAARAAAEEHRQQLAALREVGNQQVSRTETPATLTDQNGKIGPSASHRSRQHVAVDIDIASSLEFQPITLVFRDICYTVPNPSYDRSAARAAAKAAKTASRSGSLELPKAGSLDPPKPARAGSVEQPIAISGNRASSGSPSPFTGQKTIAIAGDRRGSAEDRPSTAMSRVSSVATANHHLQPGHDSITTQEKLHLLNHITGYAEPGVLIALMGGSGAGKTTLMDVLAGRKTVGEITGDIMVNGHPKDQKTWSRVVGYCEQNDIHTPLQTVKDALLFSARLRLSTSISDEKVRAYVDEVMDIVDLMDIMYNLVGSPGTSGLSVEQRKRLTIAVELVANPSVVFMDEPTSGLDARAAAIVMQAVRNVARNGRTVMVTIHQPSIEIFEAFDKLMLIQRGGRISYFGPLGEHSSALIDYLKAVPGTPDLLPGYNPATWMLEVTGGSMATLVEAVDVDWPSLYEASALAADAKEHADWLVAEAQKQAVPPLHINDQYAKPFRVQLFECFNKYTWAYWHNPAYNAVRFGLTLITSFIYAAVYWKQGVLPEVGNIGNIQAIMGIMYSSTNFLGMINLMSAMPIVGYERVVFYREQGASMYNPFAYGIAISLVELPYLLGQALIFVPVMYWMVHFDPTPAKFFYYLIMFLETITFYSVFGQFLVYMTPSAGIAQVLGGALNFLFNIFNGFVITYPDMPKGWRWFNRVAPSTWILYGLATSQLTSDEKISYNGKLTTITEFMEERFGFYTYMQWWCLLIVLAYIVFLRITSILALRYWNFLRR